jgi:hypothetical protein
MVLQRATEELSTRKHGAPARRSGKNMVLQRADRAKTWCSSAQIGQKHGAPARRLAETWCSSAQVKPRKARESKAFPKIYAPYPFIL